MKSSWNAVLVSPHDQSTSTFLTDEYEGDEYGRHMDIILPKGIKFDEYEVGQRCSTEHLSTANKGKIENRKGRWTAYGSPSGMYKSGNAFYIADTGKYLQRYHGWFTF